VGQRVLSNPAFCTFLRVPPASGNAVSSAVNWPSQGVFVASWLALLMSSTERGAIDSYVETVES
jgi:hypothetical protein